MDIYQINLGQEMLTFVFSGVVLGGLSIAFTLENLTFFSASCMISGIMLGIGNGAVFKMVPEVSPDHIGSVTGIVGAVGGIGGFFPPIIIGFSKDVTGDYFLSFSLLSMLALVCLILHHNREGDETKLNLSKKIVHEKVIDSL